MPVRGRFYGFVGLLSAALLATPSPAQVRACWDVPQVGAARISEFETLLMVSVLRCKSAGMDMRPSLEKFMNVHKGMLETAHNVLRARFGVAKGKNGNNDYDRFVTSVANSYGMGKTEAAVCQQFGLLLDELVKTGTGEELLANAVIEMVRDPRIDGARCTALPSVAKAK